MGEAIGAAAALLAIVFAVGGFLVKYALLPWLQAHIVKPMKETSDLTDEVHRQVTVNNHVSPEPTVLDKLDSIASLFADHAEAEAAEHTAMWEAINQRPDRNQP